MKVNVVFIYNVALKQKRIIDGDIIDIDVDNYSINARLSESEIAERKAKFKPLQKPLNSRWLAQYQKLVSNASNGAVLDSEYFKG